MTKQYVRRVKKKVERVVEEKKAEVHLFDEPKPYYLAKVTWSDRLIKKIFLPFFPKFVLPNHLTALRFVLIPIVCYFVLTGQHLFSFITFLVAALSDAIDGAMARTRNQITDWGIIYDPIADKLLITSLALILIVRYLSPALATMIVLSEIALILLAYVRFRGRIVPAKMAGKIKMIFECLGVGFILLYTVLPNPILLDIASYFLYLAVFFALLSLTIYQSI